MVLFLFAPTQKSQIYSGSFNKLAWQVSFRTFNWREAVGDPEVMMSQIDELLALV